MQQPSERKLISLAMATTERLALVHSTQLPVHAFSHYLCYINIYTERFIYVYIYMYLLYSCMSTNSTQLVLTRSHSLLVAATLRTYRTYSYTIIYMDLFCGGIHNTTECCT